MSLNCRYNAFGEYVCDKETFANAVPPTKSTPEKVEILQPNNNHHHCNDCKLEHHCEECYSAHKCDSHGHNCQHESHCHDANHCPHKK